MSETMEKKAITSPTSALRKLSINSHLPQEHAARIVSRDHTKIVSESWEDELVLTEDDEVNSPLSPQPPSILPLAPPPTPISPIQQDFRGPYDYNVMGISNSRNEQRTTTRPDKTDAIVKRMIAGALGVKPQPKTEEQRAYEVAMKEKEIKRRNQEKQALIKAQDEAERSKQAVWDD